MDEPVRQSVLSLINDHTKLEDKEARDLEKGIYNWCVKYATTHRIIKTWGNPVFKLLYQDKARSVVANLDDGSYLENTRLMQRLKDKEFVPHEIPFMEPQDMHPELWRAIVDLKSKKDENLGNECLQPMTDMFKCSRCKSRDCVYREMQTRSADEPATIFLTKRIVKVVYVYC